MTLVNTGRGFWNSFTTDDLSLPIAGVQTPYEEQWSQVIKVRLGQLEVVEEGQWRLLGSGPKDSTQLIQVCPGSSKTIEGAL